MQPNARPETDRQLLEKIESLAAEFAEKAEATDQGGPANALLREHLERLGALGFYGSGIPRAFGGLGVSGATSRECLSRLAAACGVTAFTQQQFHAVAGFVGGSSREELKQEILPRIADGTSTCGVGFSHLRRQGPPAVRASRQGGDVLIDGTVPWVTAWSFLDAFILGAAMEDGRSLFCYLPIEEFRAALEPSEPMRLAVMNASDTVSLKITDLRLPERYVLSERDPDSMRRGDYCGITGHVTMPLGCARGSVETLHEISARPGREPIAKVADALTIEIAECDAQSLYWNAQRADEPEYKTCALHARAQAISLAYRAAMAVIAASGGQAHLLTHPGQRRLREAAFYATQAQTTDIQMTLLEELTHG